jgi:hypothetical protein
LVYRLDSYVDIRPTVSLLRYAKGDAGCPDYAPDSSTLGLLHWPHLAMKLT